MALTAAQRLVEAEAAYHRIQIGGQPERIVDQSGESVSYSRANISRLRIYIAELKAEIAGVSPMTGPIRPVFM